MESKFENGLNSILNFKIQAEFEKVYIEKVVEL
jgi:hypothetical protein